MPFPTILPGAPWHRDRTRDQHIHDKNREHVLSVGIRDFNHDEIRQIAQAAVALPELLAAAHAAANALDALFPGWSEADIREKESEADTIIDARRQLRAALRRANNLHADGTPAQPGEYP